MVWKRIRTMKSRYLARLPSNLMLPSNAWCCVCRSSGEWYKQWEQIWGSRHCSQPTRHGLCPAGAREPGAEPECHGLASYSGSFHRYSVLSLSGLADLWTLFKLIFTGMGIKCWKVWESSSVRLDSHWPKFGKDFDIINLITTFLLFEGGSTWL